MIRFIFVLFDRSNIQRIALITAVFFLFSFVQAYGKPNIVLILADDLGYGDLSVQGCSEFETPHIDSIAQKGMRFTDAYVTGPVCAPSRAGLLTGRWQDRFGFEGNPPPGSHWGLPTGETTMAEALKAEGYRTAVFGKWHLGENAGFRPLDQGFDEFYGFLSGKHLYWKADDPMWGPMVEGDGKPAGLKQYLTFELADRACDFITRIAKPATRHPHADMEQAPPFFLFLSFNAPHAPLEVPPEYVKKAKHIERQDRRLCAAMIMALDDAVGQVLDTLKTHGLEGDTLVVFMSDNGAATIRGSDRNGGSNAPLRGSKAQLWEGGIHIPFMARWPGFIPEGMVCREPVISLDLFPTFAAIAGAAVPDNADGIDLSALLEGRVETLPQRDFFWRFGGHFQSAVRSGAWKWTRVDQEGGFYNLLEDIDESEDRSKEHPERLERLKKKWRHWNAENAKEALGKKQ